MNMARQKAERCINPSEEVIHLGQLRGRFLVTGGMVAIVAFSGFAIEAEMSHLGSLRYDDLANFASHRAGILDRNGLRVADYSGT